MKVFIFILYNIFGILQYFKYISSKNNTELIEYSSPGFTAPGIVCETLFKASRDTFSLAATLYYMLSDNVERRRMIESNKGKINPEFATGSVIAGIVKEYEFVRPKNISDKVWQCISKCTDKVLHAKIKSIDEFLAMLPDE